MGIREGGGVAHVQPGGKVWFTSDVEAGPQLILFMETRAGFMLEAVPRAQLISSADVGSVG